jgi:hypothetical protein
VSANPIPLSAGETVLRTDENAAHAVNSLLGHNLKFGGLWLTSQRIVFQSSFLGGTVFYPLRHIVKASRSDVPIYYRSGSGMAGSTATYNSSLYLEFDNGGEEYFIPAEIDAWASAILDARAVAPELPYAQMPPGRSAVGTNRGLWIILGIMAGIVLLFLCTVMACFGLPLMLSLLGGHSG